MSIYLILVAIICFLVSLVSAFVDDEYKRLAQTFSDWHRFLGEWRCSFGVGMENVFQSYGIAFCYISKNYSRIRK